MADIIPFGRPWPPAPPGASRTYLLLRQAVIEKRPVSFTYRGHRREVCPIIIGHTEGVEKALVFQFGGSSRSGLPPSGEWRCLTTAEVTDAALRDGPWIEGGSHRATQRCVTEIDLDVNVPGGGPRRP